MDPLADKLLVTLARSSRSSRSTGCRPGRRMVLIIAREFAVTGASRSQLAIEQGHVIAAGSWGKIKTVLRSRWCWR